MQRSIGNSGLLAYAIGLGAMPLSIQGRPDERQAHAVIAAFLEGGGNLIDTAISYCLDDQDFGHNERLIANALAGLGRSDVIVATKGGLKRPGGRWEVDASPEWLRHCCEESARVLGEPLDLYYLHAVDPGVPLEESVGELVRLKAEGKIAAIGLSNVNVREIDAALALTEIAAVQNRCNLYERRDFTNGVVERCRAAGIAYVPYSPVGGHFGHRRIRDDAALATVAEKHAASPYAVALAWLLAKGEHVLPIPGASRPASIRDSLTAPALALAAEDLALLDGAAGR